MSGAGWQAKLPATSPFYETATEGNELRAPPYPGKLSQLVVGADGLATSW